MRTVLTGWYVGYVIAAVVIVAVVGLVGWILGLARRIGVQVNAIGREITEIRGTTAPIATIGALNAKLAKVVDHAATARRALLGDGR
jgi:hypothetical protein